MEIRLTRNWKKSEYTIGRLFVGNDFFCNSLEPPIEPNTRHPKGAIPAGRYEITMNIISPKYSKKSAYKWCEGRLPRLLRIKGFEGVLIHAGNTAADTAGCILVGNNNEVGRVNNSMATLKRLYPLLDAAYHKHEPIYITIEE